MLVGSKPPPVQRSPPNLLKPDRRFLCFFFFLMNDKTRSKMKIEMSENPKWNERGVS